MDRPADLFDRENEWRDLAEFATRPGSGIELALVRGRRRQGKSFILRRLAAAVGGFYYQAVEQEREQSLAGISAALGAFLEVPGGRLAIDSWEDVFRILSELESGPDPTLVVIDEFPYLLDHSPELPSLIQRTLDQSRDGGPSIRLVLCGSALAVMASLLTGTKALRGRASLDIVVRTFDYRDASRFWEIKDPETAFLVHSIVGGTPGYRDLLPATPPTQPNEVDDWLIAGPLNPSSALFREDDYLLTEDRSLTNRSLYHSVVTAIADGKTSQSAIAAELGRQQQSVQHALRALVEAGFVVAIDDALRQRRPIYRIADPILRFHHVVTRRDMARFEDRQTKDAWADASPRFRADVLGPHFENLAREFAFRFAASDTLGGAASIVGPAVVNDPAAKTTHEVDVVVRGRSEGGSSPVLALGEAKYTLAKRTTADLRRLLHIRDLVQKREPTAEHARLLIFSGLGFDTGLRQAAQERSDLELIDLDRMYFGRNA